jgi:SAM-dependent methyltransferase
MDQRKQATQYDYAYIHQIYSQDFGADHQHFDLIDDLLSKLNENHLDHKPIVDLGCGPGTVTDYLYKHGVKQIIANDFVPEFCQMLISRYSKYKTIKVISGDMVEFVKNQPPNSIAAYIANFSIIHIPDEEVDQLFKDIYQSLCLHGLFLMSCNQGTYKGMEPEPYQAQHDKRLNIQTKLETYMNYFTSEELTLRLENVGFKMINLKTFQQALVSGDIDAPKIWLMAKKR